MTVHAPDQTPVGFRPTILQEIRESPLPKGFQDPERADRIAAAALHVVEVKGVEGLTHRAVAAAAEVPLGSTTYHFKTLDDLLAAALNRAKATTDAELEQLSDALTAGADLVDALSQHLSRLAETALPRSAVEYELYVAALRRPSLRRLSLSWLNALPDMLARHTDPVNAQALAYVFDGVLLQSILRGVGQPRAEVDVFLRRALGSAG